MADSPLARGLRIATLALQALIVGTVVYSLARMKIGLVLNTVFPLLIAAIPLLVRRRYGYRLNEVLSALIVTGAAFHAVGALGLYQSIGWFDQVAHGVAGMLVGGLGYVLLQVIDTQHDGIVIPPRLRFLFVLIFAMAIGVAWEIAEFGAEIAATLLGGESVLSQYGLDDAVLDLVFDGIGAVIVALWGTRYFDDVRGLLNERLGVGRESTSVAGDGGAAERRTERGRTAETTGDSRPSSRDDRSDSGSD